VAFREREQRASFGLFRWPLTYMSGFDNDVATSFTAPDTVIPADLSAWMTLEYRAASRLARLLGLSKEAGAYAGKARQLAHAINQVLWYDELKTYAAYDPCAGRHHFHLGDPDLAASVGHYAFQSCSNLIPLYARVAPRARAVEMIRRYVLSPGHFLSPHGIRSLSRSSEYYNNAVWGNPPRFGGDHRRMTNSNWQGPVWIPLGYFMAHALRFYGFPNEAADLAARMIGVLARGLRSIGSFTENYDAETGAPLYARNFASWNILADILPEEIASGRWIMDPVFGRRRAEPEPTLRGRTPKVPR